MLIIGRLRLILYRLEESAKSGYVWDLSTAYLKVLPGLRKLSDRIRKDGDLYCVHHIEYCISLIEGSIKIFQDNINRYIYGSCKEMLIDRQNRIVDRLKYGINEHYLYLTYSKKRGNHGAKSVRDGFYINPGNPIHSRNGHLLDYEIPSSQRIDAINRLECDIAWSKLFPFPYKYTTIENTDTYLNIFDNNSDHELLSWFNTANDLFGAEYEIPEDIAQELLDDGYELPPEIMENLQDRQQSDGPHHAHEELEEAKKVVRITFMTEVYIEGDSYDEIRAKWEEMPLYSYYSNCNFMGVESCENAETMEDCMSDVFI